MKICFPQKGLTPKVTPRIEGSVIEGQYKKVLRRIKSAEALLFRRDVPLQPVGIFPTSVSSTAIIFRINKG